MLTLFLLAQLAFVRPHFPQRRELTSCGCRIISYEGEFKIPKNGIFTLDYKSLYPGQYDGKTVIAAAPVFDDGIKPGHGNQIPMYVVDEGYDHIKVRAKPETHWHYSITMAVPK